MFRISFLKAGPALTVAAIMHVENSKGTFTVLVGGAFVVERLRLI